MESDKILITGTSGLLGSTVLALLNKAGYKTRAFSGDITKTADVNRLKKDNGNYGWIIHTAAITNVKQCEEKKTNCKAVNLKGTKKMVNLAKHFKAKFLYISTTSIFSGQAGNYREKDKPHPLNYYSKTKYEGEKIVLKYSRGSVLRINLIGIHPQGSRGLNFFEWLYDSFAFSRDMKLFQDVIINPLSNLTLAEIILALIKNKNFNDKILHLGSRDHLSKAAIGQLARKFFPNYRGKIELAEINQLDQEAEKPNQMWLNSDLAQTKYKLKMPLLKEEVSKIFNNLKKYDQ